MAVFFKPTIFRLSFSSRAAFRNLCNQKKGELKKGLVLGAYSSDGCVTLTKTAEEFNEECEGNLKCQLDIATGKEIKEEKAFVFYGLGDYHSVAVVGLGKEKKAYDEIEIINQDKESRRIAAAIGCKALKAVGATEISVESLDDAEAAAEGSLLGTFKYQEFKTKKDPLPEVKLFSDKEEDEELWQKGSIKARAQNFARTLMDTPANHMTPTIFAEVVQKELNKLNVSVEVHDEDWAKCKGMNSFLSVAQGSEEPPKFLEIKYLNSQDAPFVLVGKGVTFDSGGISIKPSANMCDMRADMGGAATVAATIYGLAHLKVPVNIVGLIPLTENMPSGKATKPGDVFKAMNGKTICVDNTDAEGRLILADALCYSSEFKPKWVLDIATLTGAMVVALGNAATGVFSNSNKLYKALEEAGATTGDRVWRFPLWKHYTKQISEYQAFDLNNIGKGKGGGSATAAAFLREFVPENTEWMHLDMASVMGAGDKSPYIGAEGMTGRPTRTLIEFISSQANSKKPC